MSGRYADEEGWQTVSYRRGRYRNRDYKTPRSRQPSHHRSRQRPDRYRSYADAAALGLNNRPDPLRVCSAEPTAPSTDGNLTVTTTPTGTVTGRTEKGVVSNNSIAVSTPQPIAPTPLNNDQHGLINLLHVGQRATPNGTRGLFSLTDIPDMTIHAMTVPTLQKRHAPYIVCLKLRTTSTI